MFYTRRCWMDPGYILASLPEAGGKWRTRQRIDEFGTVRTVAVAWSCGRAVTGGAQTTDTGLVKGFSWRRNRIESWLGELKNEEFWPPSHMSPRIERRSPAPYFLRLRPPAERR